MPERDHPLTYAEHLQLSQLLSCQQRQSELFGRPAHDEMLFIIVHQTYELWFKQVLFEVDRLTGLFAGDRVGDRNLGQMVQTLGRIVEIEKLMVAQFDVLETMTPLDFLEFRDLLVPASGFQSLQFRLFEIRLGLTREERSNFDQRPFDASLGEADRQRLRQAEAEPSLRRLVAAWLERTPFLDVTGYRFRDVYHRAVSDMLDAEAALVRANTALAPARAEAEIAGIETAKARFESIFDEARYQEHAQDGAWRLSLDALQAALFINLYRDEPALQLPFRLLSRLMDVDETLTTWRYRHALMVQRMIGRKVGTGGSSGHDYLRSTAERHRVFSDLFQLSTFLIPRSKLPPLPDELSRAMGYRFSPGKT